MEDGGTQEGKRSGGWEKRTKKKMRNGKKDQSTWMASYRVSD